MGTQLSTVPDRSFTDGIVISSLSSKYTSFVNSSKSGVGYKIESCTLKLQNGEHQTLAAGLLWEIMP
ncbi:UNVERIFIED_CONTAM: hypothetical protein NCL1_27375 [Trichonephila clavipes]